MFLKELDTKPCERKTNQNDDMSLFYSLYEFLPLLVCGTKFQIISVAKWP